MPEEMFTSCIGIDVGGTFTDAVVIDGSSITRAKALTTKDDIGRGVIAACEAAALRYGTQLTDLLPKVRRFGLGTTAVTNVIASQSGLKIGLLTTHGTEDMLMLAAGRFQSENGWLIKPPIILPRSAVAGVRERLDRDGKILVPLDVDEVVRSARGLVKDQGVAAIAISFLFSFRNSLHEQMAADAVRRDQPGIKVVTGSETLPLMREYERTVFAALTAYVGNALTGIEELADHLVDLGLSVPLLLVGSNGGALTVRDAQKGPIALAASGPAVGVTAAAEVARQSSIADAITCDMGGTTLDVGIIERGHPLRRIRGELMGHWTAMSSIDVDSIGSGGGSIGWIDAIGKLRVGPRSAGAEPGPACYARGGTQPTVTDALLVLGYLAQDSFLGGSMALDRAAAERACDHLGMELGLSGLDVAAGIHDIALTGMVTAVRKRFSERGLDPDGYAVVSYGGCGGLFSASIAHRVGAGIVLFPEFASVLSAFGASVCDIRYERSRSLNVPVPVDGGLLEGMARQIEAELSRGFTRQWRRMAEPNDLV